MKTPEDLSDLFWKDLLKVPHQGDNMNIDDVRRSYSSGDDYWAAEITNMLDKELPGAAFNWAKTCVLVILELIGEARAVERSVLQSALLCEESQELMRFSEKVEETRRDALSLAVANLIVAKVFDLKGELKRSRFFLNIVMMHLANYCRDKHIPPDVLFSPLHLNPQ